MRVQQKETFCVLEGLWRNLYCPLFKQQEDRGAEPFRSLVICDSRFESQIANLAKS